jgi:hypothetical protein
MNLTYTKDSVGSIDKVIMRKIQRYKQEDKKYHRKITNDYISVEDVKNLLIKQNNKCYVCHDIVITQEWYPHCLYQFTLDRINNTLPHNRNNVLICCNYCNSYSHLSDKERDTCCSKLCLRGCHTIKRNISRTRYDVPMREIIDLLLDCNIKLSDCYLKISDDEKKLYHYDIVCNLVKNEVSNEKEYQFNRKSNNEDDNEDDNEDYEELFEIEIDDVSYFASDEENGILYEITSDGEPGEKIGIMKNGEPIFEYDK